MKKTVWLFSAAAGLTGLGLKEDVQKPWKDAEKQLVFAMPMVSMEDRRAELSYGNDTILGGSVHRMFSPYPIRKAAGMRDGLMDWRGVACGSFYL